MLAELRHDPGDVLPIDPDKAIVARRKTTCRVLRLTSGNFNWWKAKVLLQAGSTALRQKWTDLRP